MNEESVIRRISEPLYRARGWVKFAGVLFIIQGVISALSIVGLLIAWIPIWMGVVLYAASNQAQIAFETDDPDALRVSLDKLGTYFRIFGVQSLIMMVFVTLALFAAVSIPAVIAMRQAALGQ